MINILPSLIFSNIYQWPLNDNSNGSRNGSHSCFIVFKHVGNSLMNLILLTEMSLLMTFLGKTIVLIFPYLGVT